MVEFKKTKYGWVAIIYWAGYDDEMHSATSPSFRTQTEAERYAIDEMGAIKCMFCNRAARHHFNAFGNKLIFNSDWMQGDYYTCDACVLKVKEDIAWRRKELEERLKNKAGISSRTRRTVNKSHKRKRKVK